ncbi:unnamed protein product [Schistosoma mattheei]|uniref:Uncharacterized protein n=1 Tax=Schistosoma mattheei TaxID=31246 RepID=A0A183NHD3_9TREM|nr:unnamed protein product [Schistosoma mattheei]
MHHAYVHMYIVNQCLNHSTYHTIYLSHMIYYILVGKLFYMEVFQHHPHMKVMDRPHGVHTAEIHRADNRLLYYINHLLLYLGFSNITMLNVGNHHYNPFHRMNNKILDFLHLKMAYASPLILYKYDQT